MNETKLESFIGIRGILEFRDANGELVQTVEIDKQIPLNTEEVKDGDQRSE